MIFELLSGVRMINTCICIDDVVHTEENSSDYEGSEMRVDDNVDADDVDVKSVHENHKGKLSQFPS